MTTTRLLFCMFLFGGAFKAIWIAVWKWTRIDWLLSAMVNWDPIPFRMAELSIGFFYDQRRVLPGPAESTAFEVLLLLGSSLQWVLLGLSANMIWKALDGRLKAPLQPRP